MRLWNVENGALDIVKDISKFNTATYRRLISETVGANCLNVELEVLKQLHLMCVFRTTELKVLGCSPACMKPLSATEVARAQQVDKAFEVLVQTFNSRVVSWHSLQASYQKEGMELTYEEFYNELTGKEGDWDCLTIEDAKKVYLQ